MASTPALKALKYASTLRPTGVGGSWTPAGAWGAGEAVSRPAIRKI